LLYLEFNSHFHYSNS